MNGKPAPSVAGCASPANAGADLPGEGDGEGGDVGAGLLLPQAATATITADASRRMRYGMTWTQAFWRRLSARRSLEALRNNDSAIQTAAIARGTAAALGHQTIKAARATRITPEVANTSDSAGPSSRR